MSRMSYDTNEPAVIDDSMLQTAIEEQGPKDEPGRIAKTEGIEFSRVKELRLDFRNILKIDNLWQMTALTKLQLDNNLIEVIEGLDALVNLVWLDLSFNNIEVIEGLDKLVLLEDLTLYHNRILKLENLDKLQALHVFSVGANRLEAIENTLYLRKFPKLKSLNLSGNPLCSRDEYIPYVIAHLPSIEYLDYKLIDATLRAQATDRYQISIDEIVADERAAERKQNEESARKQQLDLHKVAYVENLGGSELFESLYADDVEGHKINQMPGVKDLLDGYREKVNSIAQQIFEFGLQEHVKHELEKKAFWECVNEAKRANESLASKAIEEFNSTKTKTLADLGQQNDPKVVEQLVAQHNAEILALWERLMGYEMLLVDQLEEVVKDFERNYSDLVGAFVEQVQAFMAQVRELEAAHHERLLDMSSTTLEKVLKNELEEELPDDLRLLFVDKDTITNAVAASHDQHQLKIDSREDSIVRRANEDLRALLEKVHLEQEVLRNRARVAEINHLIDNLREQLDDLAEAAKQDQ